MTIEEITGVSGAEQIVKFILSSKKDEKYTENLKKLKEEWNVDTHKVIIDKKFLPDKEIKDAKGNITGTRFVNRISIPYQKTIVNRAVSFGFANEVQIEDNAGDDKTMSEIAKAVKRILFENKEVSFNRKIARDLYRSKETAEIWYFHRTDTEHENYGFKTPYKIKCMQFSSWKDDTLYPIFDQYEDMKAFARGYSIAIEGKLTAVYDVYTDTETRRFAKTESGWVEVQVENSGVQAINKIPVVFAEQEQAEWEDVRNNIERLELLLSKHAEINDYHASPKTFIKGEVKSVPIAGESNPILKGGSNDDVKILSWQHAPESVKLEIENLIENIHKFTQTPDVSFNSIKSLSQVSGVMLKMLFMDAHLKVMEKNEIWNEYFTRRYNTIKTMLGALNPTWNTLTPMLELSPVIKPFMIDDEKSIVEMITTANGNKPIISHKTSIQMAGFVENVDEELALIAQEEEIQMIKDSSSPVMENAIPEEI